MPYDTKSAIILLALGLTTLCVSCTKPDYSTQRGSVVEHTRTIVDFDRIERHLDVSTDAGLLVSFPGGEQARSPLGEKLVRELATFTRVNVARREPRCTDAPTVVLTVRFDEAHVIWDVCIDGEVSDTFRVPHDEAAEQIRTTLEELGGLVAIYPDKLKLAVLDENGTVRIVEVRSNKEVFRTSGVRDIHCGVNSIAIEAGDRVTNVDANGVARPLSDFAWAACGDQRIPFSDPRGPHHVRFLPGCQEGRFSGECGLTTETIDRRVISEGNTHRDTYGLCLQAEVALSSPIPQNKFSPPIHMFPRGMSPFWSIGGSGHPFGGFPWSVHLGKELYVVVGEDGAVRYQPYGLVANGFGGATWNGPPAEKACLLEPGGS